MDSETPGWDAIDARLAELYPGVEPLHFGTMVKFALGGPDPLDGVSFYSRDDHWHIVSYGMSSLYATDSSDIADVPEESGWGLEFTMRVALSPEPPMWAADLLQNLARYVFSSGNWFEPGHHMNANGPIRQDYETAVTALAFTEDPELGTISTPNGRVQFLQVVGLTTDEYEAARQWDTTRLLALLADRDPLLITDLDRPSATDDPAVRGAVEEGRARDGSSTNLLMIAGFTRTVSPTEVRLGFKAITTTLLGRSVQDRLGHGRDLWLEGDGQVRVKLQPGEGYDVREPAGNLLELDLPPEAVAALPTLLSPGIHPLPGTSVIIEVHHDQD